jgi:alcohol dehydrogenase
MHDAPLDTATTPMLLEPVIAKSLRREQLITHRFALDDIARARDTFGSAAHERALKVVISAAGVRADLRRSTT